MHCQLHAKHCKRKSTTGDASLHDGLMDLDKKSQVDKMCLNEMQRKTLSLAELKSKGPCLVRERGISCLKAGGRGSILGFADKE